MPTTPCATKRSARFRLDLDALDGDSTRARLPHPETFAALHPGAELLLDDGKLRLRVDACGPDYAETTVQVGGWLSDRKGVNVPGVVLPISPLTAKDRADLAFGLELGVDWVALSFVQRPEDVREARALVGKRAWIMAKLEKPAAIDALAEIVALSDGIMVARGDQGWQYRMAAYRRELTERGVLQSMSRKGNCHDNAAMESFFAVLKSEFFYLNKFANIDQLEAGIADDIHYYNYDRIKLNLGGLSPVQFRTQHLAA